MMINTQMTRKKWDEKSLHVDDSKTLLTFIILYDILFFIIFASLYRVPFNFRMRERNGARSRDAKVLTCGTLPVSLRIAQIAPVLPQSFQSPCRGMHPSACGGGISNSDRGGGN